MTDQKPKVHLRLLGCRLNQSEIDTMARQLAAQGHTLSDDPAQAGWHIVNTCAVTSQATRASRKLVRELNRANPAAEITVTGCYAHLAPGEIAALPGVARVIDNHGKETLVEQLTGIAPMPFDAEPVSRDNRPGRTRAFVKVQDGCDNACTFCITTVARGAGRSRPVAEVLDEVRALHAMGYQEAVLTGVHLGSYGHDRGDRDGLYGLVAAILSETDIPRVRLSSLEPWDLSAGFFRLWESPRLCQHLHLPLQSGADRVLKRMLRRTTQREFRALVEQARAVVPHISITTDVIAGFPGETEADFDESYAFIEAQGFAGLHVFPYSARPGTAAARMRGQLSEEVRRGRARRLIELSDRLSERYARAFVGTTRPVLWEQVSGATEDGFVNVGYTDNYIRVRSVHPRVLTNHILPARLEAYDPAQGWAVATPALEPIVPTEDR